MSYQRKLIYKVYQEDGTYIETLTDVVSDLRITKNVNGGDSEFVIKLDRKMDDFDEGTSISFNNRIKVFLQDEYNTAGTTLVAYGYIVSYSPYLRGKEEGVEVTCLSAISKLSNDFYRTGTASAASDLGVELTSVSADQMMEAIVDHYRSTETNSMISNDYTNVDTTPDNDGNAITFDHRFFNMKHIDAMREASKFFPRHKTGGYWFYWRIDTEGKLWVKNISTTADHSFVVGKHITEVSGMKTIEGMVNRVYFWNEKGTVDPDYIKTTTDDSTSQTDYDIISEYITDSKITDSSAAGLLTNSRIYDKKDPKVKIKVILNGEYDLASIRPGQTCKILNVKNNPYKIGSDDVLFIYSVNYMVDSAELELADAPDNFEEIVESERQRLDKEMTWFGYITQQLTAAQLGPANRSWSTDIEFSATSGGDAYRQVDWTTGTVYVPSGASGSSSKRVIDSGDTTTALSGYMSAGTDYFIYLDEETFNTSASNSETGTTGIVREGGETLTDSSKSWSNDQWKGYILTIGGQTKIIKSNTATVLTIEDRWTISDQTSSYTIKKMTFDVSTDRSAISDMTKVVFSNVTANTSSSSEAIVVPAGNSSSYTNTTISGGSGGNIAKSSITANEINTGAINIGVWEGDSSDITQVSDYRFVSDNQQTGAQRGYNGLNSSNRYAQWLKFSEMTTGTNPTTGVVIDSAGIRGYKSSVKQFEIATSTGDAYFKGEIGASVIIGSTITTANNGYRLRMSNTQAFDFMYNDIIYATVKSTITPYSGKIGVAMENISGDVGIEVSGSSDIPGETAHAMFYSGSGSYGFGMFYDNIGDEHYIAGNVNIYPMSSNEYDIGSDSANWKNLYLDTVGYVTSSGGEGTPFPAASGWSVSKISTGRYTVTHNIGSTSYAVTITPVAAAAKVWAIDDRSSNSFSVRIGDSSWSLEDNDFMFILIRN